MVNSKIRQSKGAASFFRQTKVALPRSLCHSGYTFHSSPKKKKPSNSGEPFHICNVQNLITWG